MTKNVVDGRGRDGHDLVRRVSPRASSVLALHGLSADAWRRFSDEGYQHYEVVEPGFKYNMTDLQAALGIHQLARVEENLRAAGAHLGGATTRRSPTCRSSTPAPEAPAPGTLVTSTRSCSISTPSASTRDDLLDALHRQNIGTGVHYRALHLHPYYRDAFGYQLGDFPNAEWISERTLSLPLSPKLTEEDVADVVTAVRRTLERS